MNEKERQLPKTPAQSSEPDGGGLAEIRGELNELKASIDKSINSALGQEDAADYISSHLQGGGQ